jgi:hypothetical protein
MALTNLTVTNQVQILYPTQTVVNIATAQVTTAGNNVTDAGGIIRAAIDGDREAVAKIAGGEGGPDFIFTGNSAGAETVTFDAPILSLLKLYAAQVSGVTRLVVKAKVSARSVAVATSGYWEVIAAFDDIAGTMTAVSATVTMAAVEGGATTDPTLTISTTNVRTSVATLAAAAIRVELYVNHVQ